MPAPTTEIILSPAPALQPAPLFTPTPKAAKRVLEFFTAQVNNDHTRKAYLNATRRFAAWCDEKGGGGFRFTLEGCGVCSYSFSFSCWPRRRSRN